MNVCVFLHSNGTFVNWELVGKGNKRLLKDGDEIVLYMGQTEISLGSTLRSAAKLQHGQTIMYRLSIEEDKMDDVRRVDSLGDPGDIPLMKQSYITIFGMCPWKNVLEQ